MTYADKSIYEGDFVNGQAEGTGVLTFIDGDTYMGNFKDNLFHGQGKYK